MSMRRSALVLTTLCLAFSGACEPKRLGSSTGSGGEGGAASSSGSSGSSGKGSGYGEGGAGTVNGDCFEYKGWNGSNPKATFAADVLPIFRASCSDVTTCHGSEILLTPGEHFYGTPTSYGAMTAAQIQEIFTGAVGVPSVDEPDMDVIKAGDPANSFMLYKLDATPDVNCSVLTCAANMTCLLPMPYDDAQLSLATRDIIRRWITQGAKND